MSKYKASDRTVANKGHPSTCECCACVERMHAYISGSGMFALSRYTSTFKRSDIVGSSRS